MTLPPAPHCALIEISFADGLAGRCFRNMIHRFCLLALVLCVSAACSRVARAQILIGQPIAGIDVDANGVLRVKQFDPRLAQQRLAAARAQADTDVMRRSPLRKVSLNRLEAVVADQLATGDLSDEIRALAGLTAVQYVFFYPDSGDIVIAGPAEGFFADPTDRLIGMETGQPVVLLEDLVTALRAYAPGAPPTPIISVSIDPTAEGLRRMNQFLASVGRSIRPGVERELASRLQESLGLQQVTFQGIPTATHFARVLVEADYRMKLVGIGLEELPVRVKSYVARAHPRAVAANAMERWYFQPNYDGIAVSEDGLAMKILERGVQLVSEHERVAAGGERQASGRINQASQAFCRDFTAKFPEIAEQVRVYAELRQLIDVAIAAAYIQQQDFYGQAAWQMAVLGDESRYAVETYTVPATVESAVNAIWRGATLMTPIGGGVHVRPLKALDSEHLVTDGGENNLVKQSAQPSNLAADQWWWD